MGERHPHPPHPISVTFSPSPASLPSLEQEAPVLKIFVLHSTRSISFFSLSWTCVVAPAWSWWKETIFRVWIGENKQQKKEFLGQRWDMGWCSQGCALAHGFPLFSLICPSSSPCWGSWEINQAWNPAWNSALLHPPGKHLAKPI